MYLEHFSLKRHPFRITPDPTLFCPGGGRGEVLEALVYAITSGEGIVKVVGEVGSGKTMLCRILEERLPSSVEIVYLANPKLSPRDILHVIAFELKLPVQAGCERLTVMQALQEYLLRQHEANRSVVVFIEEAQGMALETLEEIRLLSNLETHRHKLLQIVLFGQPELDRNLRQREIRQLKERITHSFQLGPLSPPEISEYMRFRLQAAGCGKSGVFSPGAERLIAKVSCGLIRRVNILADKAMLAAFVDPVVKDGSASSRAMVHTRHVRAAVRDSEFRLPVYRSSWFVGVTALLVVFIAGCGGAWWFLANGRPVSQPEAEVAAVASGEEVKKEAPAVTVSAKGSGPVADQTVAPKSSGTGVAHSAAPETEKLQTAMTTPVPEPAPTSSQEEQVAAGAPGAVVSHPDPVAAQPPETLAEPVLAESNSSLFAQRRQAGSQWLEKVLPGNYAIQLMSAEKNSEKDTVEDVERLLRQVQPVTLLEKIHVCLIGEKQHWVVLYGEFSVASEARKALEELPQPLRRYQPFIRPIGVVQHPSVESSSVQ